MTVDPDVNFPIADHTPGILASGVQRREMRPLAFLDPGAFTRTYAVVPLQTLDQRSGGPLNCGYPVRRETGIERVTRMDTPAIKNHRKSDNLDFLVELKQFTHDK
jgi:hypothetical protein